MRVRFSWLAAQYTELVAATRFLSVIPLPGLPQRFDTDNTTTEFQGHPQGDAPPIHESTTPPLA